MTAPVVALLTDFSTRDWYVAAMKGVILSRAPRARLMDITHDIPPQDVIAGAFVLAAALPWLPRGTVVVAVVDPGVGSRRAILACRADGRYLIGPDNGLLSLCLRRSAASVCVAISPSRLRLTRVSRTFQGRDVMAPAAALLANGRRLESLGSRVTRTVDVPLPAAVRSGNTVTGHIAHIDAYGNLITTLEGSWLTKRAGRVPRVQYQDQAARVVSSYAEGRAKELIAVVGSLGLIELATREGSAAWATEAKRLDPVVLTWAA